MARKFGTLFILFNVTFLFCNSPTLSTDTCGLIGNTNEAETTPSRDHMLYLDTENPATCTGNVTSLRVCYYQPANFTNSTLRTVYRALYGVYRKLNSESYVRVSESLNATVYTPDLPLLGTRDQEIASGFNCYDDVLDQEDSSAFLKIERGDVLGACIVEPNDLSGGTKRHQLDIISKESGHSLMQASLSNSDCLHGLIIPAVISVEQLSVVSSRKMHVYANIGKPSLMSVNFNYSFRRDCY